MLKNKKFWCPVMIALIVLFDQFTKHLAKVFLYPDSSVTVVKNFLEFRYAENTGVAFSMFSGGGVFFIILTAVVVVGCLIYMFGKSCQRDLWLFWTLGVIVSGGIGNLIDRIFLGYVIDFINPLFVNFAIFNIADCAVTLGTISIIAYLLYNSLKKEKKNE